VSVLPSPVYTMEFFVIGVVTGLGLDVHLNVTVVILHNVHFSQVLFIFFFCSNVRSEDNIQSEFFFFFFLHNVMDVNIISYL
jgi:hypothetical protein